MKEMLVGNDWLPLEVQIEVCLTNVFLCGLAGSHSPQTAKGRSSYKTVKMMKGLDVVYSPFIVPRKPDRLVESMLNCILVC